MFLIVGSAVQSAGAGEVEFQRQMVNIPTNTCIQHLWRFVDVDRDGRKELLALDPVAWTVSVYRQAASGFPVAPQQVIELPRGAAWQALAEIEPRAGMALVIGTADGVSYLRQQSGVFEQQLRPIISARQVFTNSEIAPLVGLKGATNAAQVTIPVIAADRAVLYRRDNAGAWQAVETLPLQPKRGGLRSRRSDWATIAQPATMLNLWQPNLGGTNEWWQPEPDEATAKEIQAKIEKTSGTWHVAERVKVMGQHDLAVWGCTGYIDTRTDISLYLLGADDRFPSQPTQVLRGRGFPVKVGFEERGSPFCDLNGDGHAELVLVRLKPSVLTSGGVADVVLSGAMDWYLTVRTFKSGAFANRPDATLLFTIMLPPEEGPGNYIRLEGDFNGDGRRDLLAKRTPVQWQVYLSTTDGTWFEHKPGLTFEVPEDGEFYVDDLNGDGCSDLVVQPWNQPRVLVFLSTGRARLGARKRGASRRSRRTSVAFPTR